MRNIFRPSVLKKTGFALLWASIVVPLILFILGGVMAPWMALAWMLLVALGVSCLYAVVEMAPHPEMLRELHDMEAEKFEREFKALRERGDDD